jgi:LCP family protein required for cell wall assembly
LKAFKIFAASLSFILGISTLGFAGGSYYVTQFENNITVIETSELAEVGSLSDFSELALDEVAPLPEEEKYPVTILLVGSDTREGQGGGFGKSSGARSDTTIVVKMNSERTHAAVVSIARDIWVKIPECVKDNGDTLREQYNKFNAAYAFGGSNCMIATLKENFGIEVNHIAVVDFLGFKRIVDIIGGVEVCVAKDINDKSSGLQLTAGRQLLDGKQSLAFVRARKNLGDGSDISRSDRQKMFLASMFNTAQNNGTFYNLPKLYQLLDAMSQSLAMDAELASVNKMVELAMDANNIGAKRIQFLYLPWQSRGDGSIELREESYEILDSFNSAELPIAVKPKDKSNSSSNSESEEQKEKYSRDVFTADLDMCDASIR